MMPRENQQNLEEEPSWIQKLMGKFSYSQKIGATLSCLIFVAVVMSAIFIATEVSTIYKVRREILGVRYVDELREIVELLTKQQIQTQRYLTGNSEAQKELTPIQEELARAFEAFKQLNEHYASTLSTSEEALKLLESLPISPQKLFTLWQSLNNSLYTLKLEESNNAHQELIKRFNDLIIYIGVSSFLSLDPEIEIHYLTSVSLNKLPAAQVLINQIILSHNKEEIAIFYSLLEENVKVTRERIEKVFIKDANLDEEAETKHALIMPLNNYLYSVDKLLSTARTIGKNGMGDDAGNLKAYGLQASNTNFYLWRAVSNEISNLLSKRAAKVKVEGYLVVALVTAILILASVIGFLVLKETNRFFRTIFAAVKEFSQGDLSSRALGVAYDTELEKMRLLLNELGDRIEGVITQLQSSCIELASSTTEIAAAAKHQEKTVFNQEATTKQILKTTGDIASTAEEFSYTMDAVSQAAEETSRVASRGQKELLQIDRSINQMVAASGTIASKLATLEEKATAITSVITTITAVADRTNLLSLNAAIEAEKAGPQGKSFSVIAREIRRLSDQVASATLDIEMMITEMLSSVSEGVVGVDRFNQEINLGAAQVSEISGRFSSIIEQVKELSQSFETVNQGMKHQFLSAEEINKAILQLSDTAQQTTESIRQFHSAVNLLTLLTKQMQASVSSMKK